MIFERAQGKMNVASLVERKTRFAVLFRNNDRSTTHLMNRLMGVMGVMEPLPQPARKSITFDRGIEFRNWRKLKPGIGTEAWFCDPQAPWQKGSVENLNKRARRYRGQLRIGAKSCAKLVICALPYWTRCRCL